MGKVHSYNPEGRSKKIKFTHFKAIFILFLVVLGVILYTSFFDEGFKIGSITGDFLDGSEKNGSQNMNASLEMETFEVEGKFSSVVFRGSSGGSINIDKLNPSVGDSEIILKEFDGEIIFNSSSIIELDGSSSEVFIKDSGLKFTEGHDVELENFKYDKVEVNDIYLRKFEKVVSGMVNVGGIYSDLDEKKLLLKYFSGDVYSEGEEKTVSLVGKVEEGEIGEGNFLSSF